MITGQTIPDAIATLLHCRCGKSDQRPLRQPVGYMYFNDDIDGVDAQDGGGLSGGKAEVQELEECSPRGVLRGGLRERSTPFSLPRLKIAPCSSNTPTRP